MKATLLSFYSEEDKKQLLKFRSASELLPRTPAAALAVDPVKPAPVPAALDVCEFTGDYVYPGSSGRKCGGANGTFCPSRIYGNLAQYQVCITRLAKLKERKKERT